MFKYSQQVSDLIAPIINKHVCAMREEISAQLDDLFYNPPPRRTNEDKRSSVYEYLWGALDKSNQEVADIAGVSPSFVAMIRKKIEAAGG